MNKDFFNTQIDRFKLRFGQKAFDHEFVRLVALEVAQLTAEEFRRMADFMIGTRPASRPPILTDFREAKLNAEKRRFEQDVNGAVKAAQGWDKEALPRAIALHYPGCKTLAEAFEVARLKVQVENANKSKSEK